MSEAFTQIDGGDLNILIIADTRIRAA